MLNVLFYNGIKIPESLAPEKFIKHFDCKVKEIFQTMDLDENVYNGKKLVTINNHKFMGKDSVQTAMLSLKPKNSKGYNHIPQPIFLDGVDVLLAPMKNCLL
jgi:hypothetical protein